MSDIVDAIDRWKEEQALEKRQNAIMRAYDEGAVPEQIMARLLVNDIVSVYNIDIVVDLYAAGYRIVREVTDE